MLNSCILTLLIANKKLTSGERRLVFLSLRDGDIEAKLPAPNTSPNTAPKETPDAPTRATAGVRESTGARMELAEKLAGLSEDARTRAMQMLQHRVEEGSHDFYGDDSSAEDLRNNEVWRLAQGEIRKNIFSEKNIPSDAPEELRDEWMRISSDNLYTHISKFGGSFGRMQTSDVPKMIEDVFGESGNPGPFEAWLKANNPAGHTLWKLKQEGATKLAEIGTILPATYPELAGRLDGLRERLKKARDGKELATFNTDVEQLKRDYEAERKKNGDIERDVADANDRQGEVVTGTGNEMVDKAFREYPALRKSKLAAMILTVIGFLSNLEKIPLIGQRIAIWRRETVSNALLAANGNVQAKKELATERQLAKFGLGRNTVNHILDVTVADFVAMAAFDELTSDSVEQKGLRNLQAALRTQPGVLRKSNLSLTEAIGGQAVVLVKPAGSTEVAQTAPSKTPEQRVNDLLTSAEYGLTPDQRAKVSGLSAKKIATGDVKRPPEIPEDKWVKIVNLLKERKAGDTTDDSRTVIVFLGEKLNEEPPVG
ncbi:MAG: hypothetical protein AAB592_00380 [Patescibacteria group bacterium]